jgi:hypothetical protein
VHGAPRIVFLSRAAGVAFNDTGGADDRAVRARHAARRRSHRVQLGRGLLAAGLRAVHAGSGHPRRRAGVLRESVPRPVGRVRADPLLRGRPEDAAEPAGLWGRVAVEVRRETRELVKRPANLEQCLV